MLLNFRIGNIQQFQLLFRQQMQGVIPGEAVRMPMIHQFSIGMLGLRQGGVRGQPQGFIAFEDVHRENVSQAGALFKADAPDKFVRVTSFNFSVFSLCSIATLNP